MSLPSTSFSSSTSSTPTFSMDEWRNIVRRVLNVWSGYQLAIEQEAGGPDTEEKHEWFSGVLAEHLHESRGLKVDSLEEWIESIFYTDFDLVLDDDSIFPTAHLLLELHGYLNSNNRMRLEQLLSTLPTEDTVRKATKSSRKEGDDTSSSGDSDMELPEQNDDDDEDIQPGKERKPRTVTDDDGWTTIVPRK